MPQPVGLSGKRQDSDDGIYIYLLPGCGVALIFPLYIVKKIFVWSKYGQNCGSHPLLQ